MWTAGVVHAPLTIVFRGQGWPEGIFGTKSDGVEAETINAFIEPKTHHFVDLLPQFGVFPVQIGLAIGKIVEVVGIGGFVVLPGVALFIKNTPAVGRLAFFGGPPMEVLVIWAIARTAGSLEPGVFGTAMVDHQVHEHFDVALMKTLEQGIKIGHAAKFFHDVLVIRNVVAVVFVGRGVDGIEPNHIYAEAFDVIQFGNDALEIADAVTIAVFKTAGVNLVDDGFFPPIFIGFGVGGCFCFLLRR